MEAVGAGCRGPGRGRARSSAVEGGGPRPRRSRRSTSASGASRRRRASRRRPAATSLLPDADGNIAPRAVRARRRRCGRARPAPLRQARDGAAEGRLPAGGRRRRPGARGARLRARRATASTAIASRRRRARGWSCPHGVDGAALGRIRDGVFLDARPDQHAGQRPLAARSRARGVGARRPLRRQHLGHRGRSARARLPDDPRRRRGQRPAALPDRHALGIARAIRR